MAEILLLVQRSRSAAVVYNHLQHKGHKVQVVCEQPETALSKVRRRLRKLGWYRTSGQLIFQTCIVPLLKISARRRIAQLMKHYHLDDTPWPGQVEMNVASVNELTPDELEQWPYQLVVIHGTRILSAELIERLQKTVLNIHTGFTPHYRGVHGMYWALCMNDAAHCGVTVHRVEKGIDTGRVLSRKLLTPSAHDNFCSYPWLQLAEGLSELDKSIRAVLGNNWPVVSEEGKGKLWYHPTWRQYLYFRWFKGVK